MSAAVARDPEPEGDGMSAMVSAAVRSKLAKDGAVDEHDLAASLVGAMNGAEARRALLRLMPRYIGDTVRTMRTSAFAREQTVGESAGPSLSVVGGRTSSPRWGNAANVHRAGLLDQAVRTERGLVRLGLCTAADLSFLHDKSKRVAAANSAQAVRYQKLTKALREARVERLDDLGEAAVREALDA